jgi:hypothetical protein
MEICQIMHLAGAFPVRKNQVGFGFANCTSAEARHEFQRLLEHSNAKIPNLLRQLLKLNFGK